MTLTGRLGVSEEVRKLPIPAGDIAPAACNRNSVCSLRVSIRLDGVVFVVQSIGLYRFVRTLLVPPLRPAPKSDEDHFT